LAGSKGRAKTLDVIVEFADWINSSALPLDLPTISMFPEDGNWLAITSGVVIPTVGGLIVRHDV
jgi:hypothetical protein